jgi:hypothetical protein
MATLLEWWARPLPRTKDRLQAIVQRALEWDAGIGPFRRDKPPFIHFTRNSRDEPILINGEVQPTINVKILGLIQ